MIRRIPVWLWIFALAVFLRMVTLGNENLWYDETFTAWIAKLPLDRVFGAVQGDVHPPTWYLVSWVTVRLLGSSEWALRLPAAIAGIADVLLLYRLCIELKLGQRVAATAALLVALMPAALYYSQEARVYSFLVCMVLFAFICLLRRRWDGFAIACLGILYSHNLGALYVAVLGLIAVATTRNAKPVAALVATGLGWLPWVLIVLRQMAAMNSSFWITPVTPGTFMVFLASILSVRADTQAAVMLILGVFTMSLISLIVARRWLRTPQGLSVIALIVLPPLLGMLVSVVWRPVFLIRAFLPSTFILMIVFAYALNNVSSPNRRTLRLAFAPVWIVAFMFHYFPAFGRTDWTEFFKPVSAQWQPDDVIYFSSLAPAILTNYYLPDLPYAVAPDAGDLNQSLNPEAKTAFGFPQIAFSDLKARRIWLIVGVANGNRPDELLFVEQVTRSGRMIRQAGTLGEAKIEIWLIDMGKVRAAWQR